MTTLPHIDWELSVQLAANKPLVAKELLGMLVDQLPSDLAEMEQAYQQQAWQQLEDLAHRCHGGVCYVGVPRLKQAAKTLENLLKAQQIADAEAAFVEFKAAVEGILAESGEYV